MPFFCYNKNDYCDNPKDCDNCDVFVFGKGGKEVPTKADRIRAMTDEELADLLRGMCKIAEQCDDCPMDGKCPGGSYDFSSWDKWLQQPAEGD